MSSEHPMHAMVAFDTTGQAGNYAREMCAFITGVTGDCGVGDDIATKARTELVHLDWYGQCVASEVDDRGCRRPVTSIPNKTQQDGTSSVAVFVHEFPPEAVLAEMLERAKLFCRQTGVQLRGYRFLQPYYEVQEMRYVTY